MSFLSVSCSQQLYIYCKPCGAHDIVEAFHKKVRIDNKWFVHPPHCIAEPKQLSPQLLSLNLFGYQWYSCRSGGCDYYDLKEIPQDVIYALGVDNTRKDYAQQVNDYCYTRMKQLLEIDPENRIQLVNEMIDALHELKKKY